MGWHFWVCFCIFGILHGQAGQAVVCLTGKTTGIQAENLPTYSPPSPSLKLHPTSPLTPLEGEEDMGRFYLPLTHSQTGTGQDETGTGCC